jgi:hypothetical protein
MEKRRKLNVSELRVESFNTSPKASPGRGTVLAREATSVDTCYAGCENTCRDTRTSEFGWRSCDHSQCWDYTCDPNGSCDQMSGAFAC